MSDLRGIYSATLTPFDDGLRPDASVAIPYYRGLLENGCDGLNVLGTTGEAMSVGVADRVAYMEALAGALPRKRLMAGTGASALGDAVTLTRACLDAGFSAALVIPPFYYRDTGDEGILRFFDAFFSRVQPRERSIMLYNFPRMSGATFHPDVVRRLLVAFPDIICGLKDSSNNVQLENDLHAVDPSLSIFPGSEALLASARAGGLAGCISGSVCLWPDKAQKAWRSGDARDLEAVEVLRDSLEGRPLIGAVRARVAQEQRNPAWLRSIPPL